MLTIYLQTYGDFSEIYSLLFNKSTSNFRNFTELLYKNMGIRPLKFQEISPVYQRIIHASISMVYVRSIELVGILT